MKTIGLIGGMSWESSAVYYDLLNNITKDKIGGFASSKCLMYSVDFSEVQRLQYNEDWEALNILMADAASRLENGGADMVLLCTNTMHICAPAIETAINIPFLHIAKATGKSIVEKGLKKIALLGTKFTMEKDFYKHTLQTLFQVETMVPNSQDQEIIHNIIYNELVLGQLHETSKNALLDIMNNLIRAGAEGLVLGCTELPLLIKQSDTEHPIFNTMEIHANEAVRLALVE